MSIHSAGSGGYHGEPASSGCKCSLPLTPLTLSVLMADEAFEDESRLSSSGAALAGVEEGKGSGTASPQGASIEIFPGKAPADAGEEAPAVSHAEGERCDGLPAWAAAEISAAAETKAELVRVRQQLEQISLERDAQVMDVRQREDRLAGKLAAFYAAVGSKRAQVIPKIAHDFCGKEAELNAALRKKYGKDLEDCRSPAMHGTGGEVSSGRCTPSTNTPPRPKSAWPQRPSPKTSKVCLRSVKGAFGVFSPRGIWWMEQLAICELESWVHALGSRPACTPGAHMLLQQVHTRAQYDLEDACSRIPQTARALLRPHAPQMLSE